MLGNATSATAESDIMVQQNVGSQILSLELQAKKFRSVRHCMNICQVVYEDKLTRLTA